MIDLNKILEDPDAIQRAADFIGSGMDNLAANNTSIDPRTNPADTLKKQNMMGFGSDLIKGASAGASFGPAGIAAGSVAAIIKNLIELPSEMERTEALNKAFSGKFAKRASAVRGYNTGGEVDGPEGEDKVKKDTKEGSFVVPTENAQKAIELGKKYLGWGNREIANDDQSDNTVHLTKGEVIFTPEEAAKLTAQGIDLNSLAPNAPESRKTLSTNFNTAARDYFGSPDKIVPQSDIITTGFDSTKGDWKENAMQYLPEAVSAAQILGGASGLIAGEKRPDLSVSRYLKKIASETAKDAGYGLDPGVKSAIRSSNARTRRSITNEITNKGGSTQDQMQSLTGLMAEQLQSNRDLEIADYRAREAKKDRNIDVQKTLANQDMAVQSDALRSWEQTEQAFAEMLGAGIGNIIGTREYKDTLDVLRKTRDTSVF